MRLCSLFNAQHIALAFRMGLVQYEVAWESVFTCHELEKIPRVL